MAVLTGLLALALAAATPIAALSVKAPGAPDLEQDLAGGVLSALQLRALPGRLDPTPSAQSALTAILSACGSDAVCLAKSFRAEQIAFGCWVRVDRAEGAATIAIFTPEVGISPANVELDGDATAASAIMERLDRLLNDAGYWKVALLRLELSPPDARVEWLTEGMDADPLVPGGWRGKPGTYQVRLRAPGFVDQELELALKPGVREVQRLSLQENIELWERPWLWIGIGAVAAGAATAAILVATRAHCACLEQTVGACSSCP
ncbi:MAG: hypothetical protein U1E65_13615 [Myxococcota bacterium]